MRDDMPLRDMRKAIRPATDADLHQGIHAGVSGAVLPKSASGRAPRLHAQNPSRSGKFSEVRNETIVGADQGTKYALYHRCLGWAFGRFPAERDARLWGMTYGYVLDGEWRVRINPVSNGRHTRGAGYTADLEKYNQAVLQGWRVLRFTGSMIKSGVALNAVDALIGGRA